MRRNGRRRARLAGAAFGVIGLAAVWFGSPAGAVIDDPDLDTEASYLYTIDVEANVVDVTIDLTIIADKPDRTTAEGVYQYYFVGYALLIPSEAENLVVRDGSGVELSYERLPSEGADQLDIDFRRNIFHRQAADIRVSFTLAAGAPGSNNIARINPAYVSFFAWTSPVLEKASVTVIAPAGFADHSDTPSAFVGTEDGAGLRLVADSVDPETYFALVSLANDEALDEEVIDLTETLQGTELGVDVEGSDVRVLSWPGDVGWREHGIGGVESGLPLLMKLVGRPWPIEDELTIMESFSPYLDGYAGWYDPSTDVIEVSDVQDDHTLYHELSHVWFHRELFTDRWITEGLADLYAAETIAAIGGDRPEPEPISLQDADAISLLEFDSPPGPEEERWGYTAAWTVMESIADEVGLATLGQVVTAAEERQMSYLGDGEPETVPTIADWRRFLDLVENVQGVDHGPVTTLVEQWVLDGDPAGQVDGAALDDRARARSRYSILVESGDGWAAPLGVRDAMTFWRFESAEGLMDDAEEALTRRDELLDLVEPTGARLPTDLETLYESTERFSGELAAALDEAAKAGVEVREAHDNATANPSILQRIGLIGTDLRAESAEAVNAFGEGRLAASIDEADEVDALAAEATRRGLIRSGATLVGVAAAAGLGLSGVRRRRRRVSVMTFDELGEGA